MSAKDMAGDEAAFIFEVPDDDQPDPTSDALDSELRHLEQQAADERQRRELAEVDRDEPSAIHNIVQLPPNFDRGPKAQRESWAYEPYPSPAVRAERRRLYEEWLAARASTTSTPHAVAPAPAAEKSAERGAPPVDVRERFPRLDMTAVLDPNRPPRQWAWEGIVAVGDHTSIVAPAGVGKSLTMLGWVIACQREERDFIGRPIRKPRRTLYLDLENSEDDWAERLTDLGVTAAEAAAWAADDSLIVISFPKFGGLDTEAGARLLFGLINAYGLTEGDLIVFDSTQRITTGPENDNDTARKLYEFTSLELKRRKISAVRTDNSGKDVSKGARGGSSKIDDVGMSWALSREKTTSGDVYTLTNLKMRSSGAADAVTFAMDDTSGRLLFVPVGPPSFSTTMAAVRLALDTAGAAHTLGLRATWDLVKALPNLDPSVTRRLVYKEQKDRQFMANVVIS